MGGLWCEQPEWQSAPRLEHTMHFQKDKHSQAGSQSPVELG